jgi:hypothetical protein
MFGQNHLSVKMLLNRDSTIQSLQVRRNSSSLSAVRTIEPSRSDAHLSSVSSVRTTCHPIRKLDRPASSVRTTCSSRPDSYTVSRSFCSSFHPSERFSSISGRLPVLDQFMISYQVPRKGRSINRPDNVVSRPDAPLRKARIAIQI